MALTAAEQFLIELINRSRLDPAAEAARLNISLNQGLSGGTIDTSAKQVLAPDRDLEVAAIDHSKWMLAKDIFSHTGSGGSSAGARMEKAGYNFSGSYTWRENLAWVGSTGSLNMSAAIKAHHDDLYRSPGHRVNTFAEGVREIGVAQVSGKFSHQGTNFNASMLTEKFAKAGDGVFITGVAYRDTNKNNFYSIGEGRSDYWIKGGGDTDTTVSAGGYAIKVGERNSVDVTVGKGGTKLARLEVDTSDGNAKLDIYVAKDGSRELHLSSSADLNGGIKDAKLLGVANLDLKGTSAGNDLIGNKGKNDIKGGGGRDKLVGKENADRLEGGSGNDKLMGNEGRDVLFGNTGEDLLIGGKGADYLVGGRAADALVGGLGADTFVFGRGKDKIRDFEDNIDTIAIEGRHADSVQDALDQAVVRDGDVHFMFDGGHKLTIRGVDDIDILANDINIL